MPLRDHFHAPMSDDTSWESFHSIWAVEICGRLNASLSRCRFRAEVQINVGPSVKADVAEFENDPERWLETNGEGGGVATAVQTYSPVKALRSIDFTFPDNIEVQVFQRRSGKQLVGVIELVSPANKDRPEHRRAFACKCAAYLNRGIGVVIVDVVTSKHFNLHHDLFTLLGEDGHLDLSENAFIYATAYRPAQRGEASQVDVWASPLAVGSELPVLPLGLRQAFFVAIDLESTYRETCGRAGL